MLYNFTDAVIFLVLASFAYSAARVIAVGRGRGVHFANLTHFLFCGVPAALNIFAGVPHYRFFIDFNTAATNLDVQFVYAFYVCGAPVLWTWMGRARGDCSVQRVAPRKLDMLRRVRWALYLVAWSPALLLIGAPSPAMYANYAMVLVASLPDDVKTYNAYVAAATVLSALSIAGVLRTARNLTLAALAWMPPLLVSIWLNGKRNIVLIALLSIFVVLVDRGILNGWKLGVSAAIALLGFVAYTVTYQAVFRYTGDRTENDNYEALRVDFGRDHGIKRAILAEFDSNQRPILEYRGESVLFWVTAFIPRQTWPEKPWPYAVYATSAAIGITPRDLGWGITTGWLEEAVANFSWAGFLLGPLAIALVCRFGDESRDAICQLLTIPIACLLLAVQLPAFFILAGIWVFFILMAKLRRITTLCSNPQTATNPNLLCKLS